MAKASKASSLVLVVIKKKRRNQLGTEQGHRWQSE